MKLKRRVSGRLVAGLMGIVCSVVNMQKFAAVGWRSPWAPHLHITSAVLLNFVVAAYLVALFDFGMPKVRNRPMAAGLGLLVTAPLVTMMAMTMRLRALSSRQWIGSILVGCAMGAFLGLLGWWPEYSIDSED